jgi:hypothetical protein
MDGLTLPLTCSASVVKDQPNHVKIAIADTADSILDSAVFVQAMNINPSEVPELSVKDGYIRLDTTNGSLPPSIDCSSPSQHAGRMVVDEENAVLYICIGTGWNAVPF